MEYQLTGTMTLRYNSATTSETTLAHDDTSSYDPVVNITVQTRPVMADGSKGNWSNYTNPSAITYTWSTTSKQFGTLNTTNGKFTSASNTGSTERSTTIKCVANLTSGYTAGGTSSLNASFKFKQSAKPAEANYIPVFLVWVD